jgi:Aspartyl/Asparaginyl beta-hydroxylase/Nif11 domain
MISNFKLPFNFDPELLKSDLDGIAADDWIAHFNTGYFEGEWTGVALRSPNGLASQLYPDPGATQTVANTPFLDRCPNIRALLGLFQCHLVCVRFLRLAAGSAIREHRDYDLGYDEGQIRLHIPIITNPHVDFFVDAHRIEMKEGECWYLDLSLPHWVANRGSTDRIHLVIDCELNDWLRGVLPAEGSLEHESIELEKEYASSPDDLERFRQVVLSDLKLQQRLRETSDRESFVRLVVALAKERGYRFTARDAEEALQAAWQAWFERWID